LISYGFLNFSHVSEDAPRSTKIRFTLWRQTYRSSGSQQQASAKAKLSTRNDPADGGGR
jgi:hypothetical protein